MSEKVDFPPINVWHLFASMFSFPNVYSIAGIIDHCRFQNYKLKTEQTKQNLGKAKSLAAKLSVAQTKLNNTEHSVYGLNTIYIEHFPIAIRARTSKEI